MDEIDFVNAVVQEADCNLLIDVNNVYVNSFNHNYDPKEFIQKLPHEKVTYIHMAGHTKIADDLIIDTHGEAIIDPVYDFFSSHDCQTPLLWQMPGELHEFVKSSKHPLLKKYPHLLDLLLFEWQEVEVYMMEDMEPGNYLPLGDVLTGRIVLNPEIRIISLSYPVHVKSAYEISSEDKGQYFICLHRELETGQIQFTDIKYPHVELNVG